jgi:probable FeS assembly SUF system protein SufT
MDHPLLRDCPATVIPAGQTVTLPAGTVVQVAQSLGGSVTVRTSGGLFRIAPADVDAIGGFVPAAAPTPAPGPADAAGAAAASADFSEEAVWAALRTCFDPEIPVNIVDLGLVYDLAVDPLPSGGQAVELKMTLTAPGCGMGPVIAEDARQKVAALPGVATARVHIVWDPVWNPRMISEAGRRALGLE